MSTSNTGCDNRKYAIYARKSKFTAKGESINQQIDRCKLHLSSMNVDEEDIIIFEDEGYSGGNTDRPQFKEMMDMCEDNKIQCVICYKLDKPICVRFYKYIQQLRKTQYSLYLRQRWSQRN